MAEYGEWNRKGATLSDGTAQKDMEGVGTSLWRALEPANWNTEKGGFGGIRISGY